MEYRIALAQIAPHLGFNCFAFTSHVVERVVDVLDASPEFAAGGQKPSHHGIPLLFPFPGRIRDASFEFGGQRYELQLKGAGRTAYSARAPWAVCPYSL